MRVFVSEYLVGGATLGMNVPASMRREGLAMLRAVTDDITKLAGSSVVTTLEAGFSFPSNVETICIEGPDHEAQVFQKLLSEVDHVLIIAPETGGILAERCRRVRSSNAVSWNCSPDAIELCGDKLRLFEHLHSLNFPTPLTSPIDFRNPPQPGSWPIVLKPKDGAGSCLTFLINTLVDFQAAAQAYEHAEATDQCICQPYHVGRALSMGVNISLDGQRFECLPVAEQCLSAEGRFHYLGGRIPADLTHSSRAAIRELVERACRSIEGLAGYVGVDLVLPPDGNPMIIEINPRLTTSYVGYRQLSQESLPGRWLAPTSAESQVTEAIVETAIVPIEFTPTL